MFIELQGKYLFRCFSKDFKRGSAQYVSDELGKKILKRYPKDFIEIRSEKQELETLKKDELINLAEERGITIDKEDTKAAIIQKLEK
ncbi:MAG: hypothetical protein J7M12_02555 [Candidatus Hydrogenedentes bacterium]|nr:hypothetical protein [Candidatus Hydrogenedentota bacterium]